MNWWVPASERDNYKKMESNWEDPLGWPLTSIHTHTWHTHTHTHTHHTTQTHKGWNFHFLILEEVEILLLSYPSWQECWFHFWVQQSKCGYKLVEIMTCLKALLKLECARISEPQKQGSLASDWNKQGQLPSLRSVWITKIPKINC